MNIYLLIYFIGLPVFIVLFALIHSVQNPTDNAWNTFGVGLLLALFWPIIVAVLILAKILL